MRKIISNQHPQWDNEDAYDVIVIGAGIGGLVSATQLAAKGLKVLVLERYIIPGGSAGFFEREGYRFDVGASMIFGFGENGTTNLLTRALETVGIDLPTIADLVQIHYHLPNQLDLKVTRNYEQFLANLIAYFPHEAKGIRKFYGICWQVFNSLNTLELLSLEEPRYLLRMFFQHPGACLRLAQYLPQNVGDVARRYIRDRELLKFIDVECYAWSTVSAAMTPMISAGMVFSDRHYGGVNYPQGGVGKIALSLAQGLENIGGTIRYRSHVKRILTENGRAIGVKLASGEAIYAQTIISNATRWDTFSQLISPLSIPSNEKKWQQKYQKSPSFLSLHMGVRADILPSDTECHHVIVESWSKMTAPEGTLFVSIPTLLDPTLAPPGYAIIHAFTPHWYGDWEGLSPQDYIKAKEVGASRVIERLEAVFPGLDAGLDFLEIGTPRTHQRFLGRKNGTYGPIPRRKLLGLVGMPFNRTAIAGLYCVGDSTFPGQGLNAVAFSGFACAHRIAADFGVV